MTLMKLNPTFNAMDRMFDRLFHNNFGLMANDAVNNIPAVNVKENETEFRLELAVPGLRKEDFQINIDNGMLTITAERKSETEEKKDHYTRREFNYTSFRRSFRLPETVAQDQIDAKYNEGVLEVVLPKAEEARPKRREIVIS
ncbi:MAG: Hsp20/alpha crystallin family protein [Microscillaceae bacterium]|nr:Hsp20/alpha crystallin family protein [Microscillaceae bacterium]